MGVILGMFRELARLGVSRAAAFFYAVAVGVVANVVIAHLSPHDSISAILPTSWPSISKSETPVATAVIAPKPAEAKPADSAHPIEASAPANSLPVAPTPAAVTPPVLPRPVIASAPPTLAPTPVPAAAALPAVPAQTLNPPSPSQPAPAVLDASATLPSAATMASPTLQPTALPTLPSAPVAADAKPKLDQPTGNVEASASPATPAAAPISLLPADADQPAADQPPPKPAKPGPGSGGLY